MDVFLLYYDEDDGSREGWSVFYTPCEVFLDRATRDARKAFVLSKRPDVEFEEVDYIVQTTANFIVERSDDDV
jgi:hypothetical protein